MSLTSLKTVSLQRFSLNFAANIIATLWMLVGSTRAFSWVKPTFIQFAVFALLALGSNVLFSWLAAESGSIFNEQGLVSYLIWPMIILLSGIILARRASNQTLVFCPSFFGWLLIPYLHYCRAWYSFLVAMAGYLSGVTRFYPYYFWYCFYGRRLLCYGFFLVACAYHGGSELLS